MTFDHIAAANLQRRADGFNNLDPPSPTFDRTWEVVGRHVDVDNITVQGSVELLPILLGKQVELSAYSRKDTKFKDLCLISDSPFYISVHANYKRRIIKWLSVMRRVSYRPNSVPHLLTCSKIMISVDDLMWVLTKAGVTEVRIEAFAQKANLEWAFSLFQEIRAKDPDATIMYDYAMAINAEEYHW